MMGRPWNRFSEMYDSNPWQKIWSGHGCSKRILSMKSHWCSGRSTIEIRPSLFLIMCYQKFISDTLRLSIKHKWCMKSIPILCLSIVYVRTKNVHTFFVHIYIYILISSTSRKIHAIPWPEFFLCRTRCALLRSSRISSLRFTSCARFSTCEICVRSVSSWAGGEGSVNREGTYLITYIYICI